MREDAPRVSHRRKCAPISVCAAKAMAVAVLGLLTAPLPSVAVRPFHTRPHRLFLTPSFVACRVVSLPCSLQHATYIRSRRLELRSETGANDVPISAPTMDEEDVEKVWRHVRKAMLRIGASGVTPSHANSLLELLDAHGAVKVKISTDRAGKLDEVARSLAERAAEIRPPSHDGPAPAEVLRVRGMDRTVLFGIGGLAAKVVAGKYPPAPKAKWVSKEEYLAGKQMVEEEVDKFLEKGQAGSGR